MSEPQEKICPKCSGAITEIEFPFLEPVFWCQKCGINLWFGSNGEAIERAWREELKPKSLK